MEVFKKLAPATRIGVWCWLITTVVFYVLYYRGPRWIPFTFHNFNALYEDQKWEDSDEHCIKEICTTRIEVTKCVADFLDSQLEIVLKNKENEPRKVTVGVKVEKNEVSKSKIYIYAGRNKLRLNTVTLEIPAYGQRITDFYFQVYKGHDGERYTIKVHINNGELETSNELAMNWDPEARFKLWVLELLLLPPGSNFLIPALTLLFIGLAESTYALMRMEKVKRVQFILGATISILGGGIFCFLRRVLLFDWVFSLFVATVFFFILGILFSPLSKKLMDVDYRVVLGAAASILGGGIFCFLHRVLRFDWLSSIFVAGVIAGVFVFIFSLLFKGLMEVDYRIVLGAITVILGGVIFCSLHWVLRFDWLSSTLVAGLFVFFSVLGIFFKPLSKRLVEMDYKKFEWSAAIAILGGVYLLYCLLHWFLLFDVESSLFIAIVLVSFSLLGGALQPLHKWLVKYGKDKATESQGGPTS